MLAAASLTAPLTALARTYEKPRALRVTVRARLRVEHHPGPSRWRRGRTGRPARDGGHSFTRPPRRSRSPTETMTMARNTLEIATPPGNPAGVGGRPGRPRRTPGCRSCSARRVCPAERRPTGCSQGPRSGRTSFSREVDVNATLAKVRLGEADAAVVYHSDVVSAGDDGPRRRDPGRAEHDARLPSPSDSATTPPGGGNSRRTSPDRRDGPPWRRRASSLP